MEAKFSTNSLMRRGRSGDVHVATVAVEYLNPRLPMEANLSSLTTSGLMRQGRSGDVHVAAVAVSVMMLLTSVAAMAVLIAEASWLRFAPATSATWAHCAATSAAAVAIALSFEGLSLLGRAFSAAMAANAAATPASEVAACTSARQRRPSSFLFCFISLNHFFMDKPSFHDGTLVET